MTVEDKNKEYQLMQNSQGRIIKVEIPNGPSLSCPHCWDYRSNLSQSSFKTTSYVAVEHPLLLKEELDLKPVTAKKIWKITVLRQQPSNLKEDGRRRKPGY